MSAIHMVNKELVGVQLGDQPITEERVNAQSTRLRSLSLSKSDKQTIYLYTEQNYASDVFRRIKCMMEHPVVSVRLSQDFAEKVTYRAIQGTAVGGVVGVVLGLLGFFPGTTLPTTAAVGAFAGSGVGLTMGLYSTVGRTYIDIPNSPEYLEWQAAAIQNKVLPIFAEFIQTEFRDNEENEDLICPITHDLISVPVRGLDDRTYERDAIVSHLEKLETQYPEEKLKAMPAKQRAEIESTFSPIRGKYFTRANLTFDHTYHEKLFKKLKDVFNKEIDKEVREGLMVYQNAVLKTQDAICTHLTSRLSQLFVTNDIPKSVFIKQLENIKLLKTLESNKI